MAYIAQPFRLANLPKISSLNNYAQQTSYLQVADVLEPTSNTVTVGVSGSSISQYVINPTPKLVYNIPIPSTNVVTGCDVLAMSDGAELWSYALTANGKVHTLHAVLRKAGAAPQETGLDASEDEHFKQTLKGRVVRVRILSACKRIMVVLDCGLIQTYDYQLQLLHSLDISYTNVGLVEYFTDSAGKDYMFVLCDIQNKKTCYKLFQLNHSAENLPITELNSVILEDFALAESKMVYQFGKLYRLVDSKMYVYSLPHFQLSHCVPLPFVRKDDQVSLQAISTNRLLLTCCNKIFLLDLLHNAILYERELSNIKFFQLLRAAVIPGTTPGESNRTFAIGVSTKQGSNPSSALDVVTIAVGTGTLKDSLGKGFLSGEHRRTEALKPLFGTDDDESPNIDFAAILAELTSRTTPKAFDGIFYKRLGPKKEYYTEHDRFINNSEFLAGILDHIFATFADEFPRALIYLLTHPLFPSSHTKGLLPKLKAHPRLFKQAVVTCPNLPLDELLHELFTVLNDELSLDLSLRVLQEFTKEDIKQGIRELSRVDLHNFLNFVIKDSTDVEERQKAKPQLFQLLSLVIDAVGLLALEGDILHRLSAFIDSQVAVADQLVELLYLLENSSTKKGKHLNSVTRLDESPVAATIPLYSVEYLDS
ncbi:FAFR307Cp [Eremothecium gossypii FDAG1]|nr:FAFR307Cp [Eremothecium gossypii FDAG1]